MSYKLLYLEDCPFSIEAERLLKEHDKSYNKIVFTNGFFLNDSFCFKDYFGESSTFPRIYFNEQLIGGCSDLEEHLKKSQSL